MKIAVIDLDDVLSISIPSWIEYANNHAKCNCKNLIELKNTLSFTKYKELKLQYRKSGIKARLPVIEGAASLTKQLSEKGYTIIIMTARPIYEIPEVFRDTLSWLKNNFINYSLIFGGSKDKHIKILKYFPEMEFMIEDNESIANLVARQGYKVYLLDNDYNRGEEIESGVIRIKKLIEVLKE